MYPTDWSMANDTPQEKPETKTTDNSEHLPGVPFN